MGQYFKLVNISKREYLVPWCCGDGAKLVEITTGSMPSLLAYLLRQSSEGGGGDVPVEGEYLGSIEFYKEKMAKETDPKEIEYYKKNIQRCKESEKYAKKIKFAGRWAGDRITLVGDYDESKLYDECDQMENISHEVMEEYNEFVGHDECGVYTPSYHKCEKYRSKEDFEELVGEIDNYRLMIKEGRCTPAEHGYEQIDRIKDAIALRIAEDEFYGKYKEPKWKFQLPKEPVKQRQSKLAPDMMFTTGGKE